MTERPGADPFDTYLADRVRAFTDAATAQPIEPLELARAAMTSRRASRPWGGWFGAGRRLSGVRWAAAALAFGVVLVAVFAVQERPSNPAVVGQPSSGATTSMPAAPVGGEIPDTLLHAWQRPYPVEPVPDPYGTAYLTVTGNMVEYGREQGPSASRSAVTAAGSDTLAVTATAESKGCRIGDVGMYRWSVEGKGTVLTLTAVGADACASREALVAGPWVRNDLPPPPDNGEPPLAAGTHETSRFDPFGDAVRSGGLSYTVPAGWTGMDDTGSFVLHHPASPDVLIAVLEQPRLAAPFVDGAPCGEFTAVPGAGQRVDDLVTAILARPGVTAAPPAAVTIGGYAGKMLDLHLDPSWSGGCRAPEGQVVGTPILLVPGGGPVVGLGKDRPVRLLLLDLGGERTVAIAIAALDPSQSVDYGEMIATAMPVIESFEFHPPTK